MDTTWFEALFGFPETSYADTKRGFRLEGSRLVSRANDRSFAVGELLTPRLAELRERGRRAARGGRLRVEHEVIGDVLELHARPENRGALFQVASQLNCLEFHGPSMTPEDGVTGYAYDPTQGPACSLAAAPATVLRNYFVPVRGAEGQTHDNQIDNLEDLAAALGEHGRFWEVRNGYTFSTPERLRALRSVLAAHDREHLLGEVRIGLQRDVEVTFQDRFTQVPPGAAPTVSQAFCSAISCAYSLVDRRDWEDLARLVLDAAYEATLWAAAINASRDTGSPHVWLTLLGGGAFGNDPRWIADALGRALRLLAHVELTVHVAHYRQLDSELVSGLQAAGLP